MNYSELKKKHGDEINAFPMGFAFSDEQFKKACYKLGVNPANAKQELLGVPGDGFIRKTDEGAFRQLLRRQRKELEELLSDPKKMIGAMRYELANHEYCITGDPTEALEALAIDPNNMTESQKECLPIAIESYMADVVC